jgi:hypothetical protein
MSTLNIPERIDQTLERLALYLKAEQAILQGQSYSIGNRSLSRPNLGEVREEIAKLNGILIKLRNGNRIRVQRVVPRDI